MATRSSPLGITLALIAGACGNSSPAARDTSRPTHDAIGSSSGSAATSTDPWAAPAAKSDPLKRPLLWSAHKAGKTTYLLGTMHLGIDAEARMPPIVWQAFDPAPVFAMETDMSDPALLRMGQRTKGTLREDLGPVYWKKLEALIEPKILAGLDKMKPMMTAALLSLRGLPMTPPMDGVLLGRAKNQNKQIVYLEPAQTQAALLEKWMDVRTIKLLIDEADAGVANAKRMLQAYAEGDDTQLLAIATSQKQISLAHGIKEAEYDQSMKELLHDRNAAWIPAIERIHTRGNGFVAVGALHLIGKGSVLDRLAAKGYTITRLGPAAQ